MQAAFEKIIEKLEEELKLADEEKLRCARENPLQFDSAKGYAHGVGKAIEIVKQEAAAYEECYNDCGECEAYYKEKHHCPKFCKVIKEAVKEIEENHNGWIPCSERLPEEHKQYDITTKNDAGIHSDTAIFNPFVGMWFWDEAENKPIGIEVLAWAEKREPYQPKGE